MGSKGMFFRSAKHLATWLRGSPQGRGLLRDLASEFVLHDHEAEKIRDSILERDTDTHYVVVEVDHDGWITVYGDKRVHVRVINRPKVESSSEVEVIDRYVEHKLPRKYHDVYEPGCVRQTGLVETTTLDDAIHDLQTRIWLKEEFRPMARWLNRWGDENREKAWRRERVLEIDKCQICGWTDRKMHPKGPQCAALCVHEIARGAHRKQAMDKTYATLVVCWGCNSDLNDRAKWPEPKQLAIVKRQRPQDYDLKAYNRLVRPTAPNRITEEEVDRWMS